MLGRDQSPPTAILMYRLQHGPRSRPPSSTLQLGTPAVLRLFQFTEHLQRVQTLTDHPGLSPVFCSPVHPGASLGG